MATTRLDMRLDEEVKLKAEKATALLGYKSLTEYVVKLIDENASKVIAQHESILLEESVFDQFLNACERASVPNSALTAASAYAENQGFK